MSLLIRRDASGLQCRAHLAHLVTQLLRHNSENRVKNSWARVSKQAGHKSQKPETQSEKLKATVGGIPARNCKHQYVMNRNGQMRGCVKMYDESESPNEEAYLGYM